MTEDSRHPFRGISLALLGAATVAALGWVFRDYAAHGVTLAVGDPVRVILFLAFYIFPYGYVFTKIIRFWGAGARAAHSIYEKVFLCLTIGLLLSGAVCYCLQCTPFPQGYVLLSGALFAYVLRDIVIGPHALRERARSLLNDTDILAAGLVLLMVVRFLITYRYLSIPASGPVYYNQYLVDNQFNVSLIYEMMRGIPMEQLPLMAGVPMWHYHFFPAFLSWMISAYAGVNVMDAFHVYLPALFNTLMIAHAWFAGWRLGGGRTFGCAAVILLFFLGAPRDMLQLFRFIPPVTYLHNYVYQSFAGFMAVPVTLAFMHVLVFRIQSGKRMGSELAAGLLIAFLIFIKFQFFLALFPAYAAYLAIDFIRLKSQRKALVIEGAFSLSVSLLLALLILSYASFENRSFMLDFGTYGNYLYLKYFYFNLPVVRIFNTLPHWLIMCIVCLVYPLFNNSGIAGLLMGWFYLRTNKRDALHKDMLVFSAAFFMSCSFIYLFVTHEGLFHNYGKNIPAVVYTFSMIPAMLGLAALVHGIKTRLNPGAWTKLKIVACCAAAVCAAASVYQLVHLNDYSFSFPRNTFAIWNHIRKQTPLDSVVMTADYMSSAQNMFGGRRSVLEVDWLAMTNPEETAKRRSDIDTFYHSQNTNEAINILNRYSVDYFMAETGKLPPVAAKLPDIATVVSTRGHALLFRVNKSAAGVAVQRNN